MNRHEWRLITTGIADARGLLESINKQLEAISKNSESDESPRNAECVRKFDLLISKLTLPVAIEEYCKSHKDEKPRDAWGWLRLILEFAGVVSVVAYVVLTYCTLDEMRTQARIMRKQLEASDRAWIKVVDVIPLDESVPPSTVGTSLTFSADGRGGYLNFKVVLKNIGKSVATPVSVLVKTFPTSLYRSPTEPIDERRKLCGEKKSPEAEFTIFPEDTQLAYRARQFDSTPMGQTIGKSPQKAGRLFILGCINYNYASSTTNHQTGFIYEVFESKMAGHVLAPMFKMITVEPNRTIAKPVFEILESGNYAY